MTKKDKPKKQRKPQESTQTSLHPLEFEEALKEILKPEKKK